MILSLSLTMPVSLSLSACLYFPQMDKTASLWTFFLGVCVSHQAATFSQIPRHPERDSLVVSRSAPHQASGGDSKGFSAYQPRPPKTRLDPRFLLHSLNLSLGCLPSLSYIGGPAPPLDCRRACHLCLIFYLRKLTEPRKSQKKGHFTSCNKHLEEDKSRL